MNTSLGENIRNRRKALGLSQEALGELIGANRVTISKYENNEYNPSVPALRRLAEALHTTPAELAGDQPDTKKEPAQGGRSRTEIILDSLNPENRAKAESYLEYLLTTQDKAET